MNAMTANAGIWAIYWCFFNQAYAWFVIKVEIKAADGTGNPREYVDADTEVDSSYNTVSYNAVVTPSVSGAFSWSTTSSKITLTDASSQIVTVNAGANASASVGAEDLKVEFTPSGSTTTCDDTHNLTVVHCTFDAFADKTVLSEYEIGHGWWKLAIEPSAATTLIQCGLSSNVNTHSHLK